MTTTEPEPGNTPQPKKSRSGRLVAGIGVAALVILAAGLVFFRAEIRNAAKLLFRLQPVHAGHIPRSALVVSRGNPAALALKTGLRGATNDPLYRRLQEYGAKLYPRFDRLVADPEKETGIEVAEDVYTFFELQQERNPGFGILFGISDQDRFAEFVQRIRPGKPSTEGGFSVVSLDGEAVLFWNKSFALLYTGRPGDHLRQRARAIMSMGKGESIAGDPVKKKWLEGRDDCRVDIDLESLAKLPELAVMLRGAAYKPETYAGSTLNLALNFDKGKLTFDTSATGAALLSRIRQTYLPPTKEFLAGIPVGSYLGFVAARIQPAPLLEAFRASNPTQYRKADDQISRSTGFSLEQQADSFTGDLCIVLEDLTRRGTEKGAGTDPPGSPSPAAGAIPSGTVAFGIKPGSAVVKTVNKLFAEAPPSEVRRDGRIYSLNFGGGCYFLADNGYLAFSTGNDTVKALSARKPGDAPLMPSPLLARATGATTILELKLGPLLASASEKGRLPEQARTALAQAGSRLGELRFSSRIEKDRAVSRLELLFTDGSKNSLNQIADMVVAVADTGASQRVK